MEQSSQLFSCLLAQCRVSEKSNEITAIPEVLALLALQDAVVTIDAMGWCQHGFLVKMVVVFARGMVRRICIGFVRWRCLVFVVMWVVYLSVLVCVVW